MKFLIILLSLVFIDNGCSASKVNQDAIFLEYSMHSRGSYQLITITKKSISVVSKRDENPVVKSCSNSNWNKILKVLKPVDIENLPNLKAPSENRFFDGASIANFKIIYNGDTYKTPSFDHGNPPKEIARLVKEVLSISENIE
ncbi:hypothetical protein QLS71_005730 [Mariniflexile litorale]|uniref:Lipoprotein n=1 Tax=Mariniflexile litorale TaxID=3045158 RepID=A0AAU7EJJ0_9FLAO|nr:hypothetical protein [Mariniflexile sp. KMM 9835]MDQ8211076.1 hypothetical protein [Mariniflexile sp. KMM 9835]